MSGALTCHDREWYCCSRESCYNPRNHVTSWVAVRTFRLFILAKTFVSEGKRAVFIQVTPVQWSSQVLVCLRIPLAQFVSFSVPDPGSCKHMSHQSARVHSASKGRSLQGPTLKVAHLTLALCNFCFSGHLGGSSPFAFLGVLRHR